MLQVASGSELANAVEHPPPQGVAALCDTVTKTQSYNWRTTEQCMIWSAWAYDCALGSQLSSLLDATCRLLHIVSRFECWPTLH